MQNTFTRVSVCLAIFAGAAGTSSIANANVIELTREVDITYTFKLSERPEGSVFVAVPGSGDQYRRFDGPLPDYPMDDQETTLTITADLPTREYINANFPAPNADGKYRFVVSNAFPTGAGDPSTTIRGISFPRPFTEGGNNIDLEVIYDYNNDNYSIASLGDSGRPYDFIMAGGTVPTYAYNEDTGLYEICGLTNVCNPNRFTSTFLSYLTDPASGSGQATATIRQSILGRYPRGFDNDGGGFENSGFFDLNFIGNWGFSGFTSEGPVEVPAPGMLLLFGLGALGVFGFPKKRPRPAKI